MAVDRRFSNFAGKFRRRFAPTRGAGQLSQRNPSPEDLDRVGVGARGPARPQPGTAPRVPYQSGARGQAELDDLKAERGGRYGPNEFNATKERAERIRRTGLGDLLSLVRKDPDIWRAVKVVIARTPEFIAAGALPGEHHRDLTAPFAGIVLDPRARRLLEIALQRTLNADTAYVRRSIASGRKHVKLLVVGGGPTSAILNAELQALVPNRDVLAVDGAPYWGGQFGRAGGPFGRLNSRNRALQRGFEERPGTRNGLNSLGNGVLQEMDVQVKEYGDWWRLWLATAFNGLMATPRAAGMTELLTVERDLYKEGAVVARIRYVDTGEIVTVEADQLVIAGGVGSEFSGFEKPDDMTLEVLRGEVNKPLQERAVWTSGESGELFAGETTPFPLRGLKNVCVVGPEDYGRVVVGALLGQEAASAHKSVPALDSVVNISWWGQTSLTKEKFDELNRIRYKEIALDMPREVDPDYFKRIEPINERAVGLEYELDAFGNRTARIIVVGDMGTKKAYDHVVLSTGFIDRTTEILGMLQPTSTAFLDPNDGLDDALGVGAITGAAGGLANTYKVLADDDEILTVETTASDKTTSVLKLSKEGFRSLLVDPEINGKTGFRSVPAKILNTDLELADGSISPGPTILTDKETIRLQLPDLRRTEKLRIVFDLFSYVIESVDTENRKITFSSRSNLDDSEFARRDDVPFDEVTFNEYFRLAQSVEVPPLWGPKSNRPDEPICRRVRGTNVRILGAASALELSDRERKIPAFCIEQNSAALFRYEWRIRAAARLIAKAGLSLVKGDPDSIVGFADSVTSRSATRPSIRPAIGFGRPGLVIQIDPSISSKPIPLGQYAVDRFRLATLPWAKSHPLPRSTKAISFTVTQGPASTSDGSRAAVGSSELQVRMNSSALAHSKTCRVALEQLLADSDIQRVLTTMLEPSSDAFRGTVHVAIPVERGAIQPSLISLNPTFDAVDLRDTPASPNSPQSLTSSIGLS